jgi:hypothetical protein
MINVLDLIIGALALFYLLKNAGGLAKTVKNFLIVIACLVIIGILSQLILSWSFAKPLHKPINDSYSIKVSIWLIKWAYPSVEKTVPKIDAFVKEKIISKPTPEVTVPKKELPKNLAPNITIPKLPNQ